MVKIKTNMVHYKMVMVKLRRTHVQQPIRKPVYPIWLWVARGNRLAHHKRPNSSTSWDGFTTTLFLDDWLRSILIIMCLNKMWWLPTKMTAHWTTLYIKSLGAIRTSDRKVCGDFIQKDLHSYPCPQLRPWRTVRIVSNRTTVSLCPPVQACDRAHP